MDRKDHPLKLLVHNFVHIQMIRTDFFRWLGAGAPAHIFRRKKNRSQETEVGSHDCLQQGQALLLAYVQAIERALERTLGNAFAYTLWQGKRKRGGDDQFGDVIQIWAPLMPDHHHRYRLKWKKNNENACVLTRREDLGVLTDSSKMKNHLYE